jgi:hypothetical protein
MCYVPVVVVVCRRVSFVVSVSSTYLSILSFFVFVRERAAFPFLCCFQGFFVSGISMRWFSHVLALGFDEFP